LKPLSQSLGRCVVGYVLAAAASAAQQATKSLGGGFSCDIEGLLVRKWLSLIAILSP
jgi:hypothetical protein